MRIYESSLSVQTRWLLHASSQKARDWGSISRCVKVSHQGKILTRVRRMGFCRIPSWSLACDRIFPANEKLFRLSTKAHGVENVMWESERAKAKRNTLFTLIDSKHSSHEFRYNIMGWLVFIHCRMCTYNMPRSLEYIILSVWVGGVVFIPIFLLFFRVESQRCLYLTFVGLPPLCLICLS